MQINPKEISPKNMYKLLTGTVVPRPIAWVSTISGEGIFNLAPYSFANAIGAAPPLVLFCGGRPSGKDKDTVSNVLATGEFVYNVVSFGNLEGMNRSATALPAHVDEFEFAELTPVPSTLVKAPRVKESLVNFECTLEHTYTTEGGGTTIVIGRIVYLHIADEVLLDDYKIDMTALDPLGRLAGPSYTRTRDQVHIDRLPSQL